MAESTLSTRDTVIPDAEVYNKGLWSLQQLAGFKPNALAKRMRLEAKK